MTEAIASRNKIVGFNASKSEPVAVSCVNIDVMMEALEENKRTIESMYLAYKEQEKLINTTMQVYATYKMKFTKEQMNAFREYKACTTEESNSLKQKIDCLKIDTSLKELCDNILQAESYEGVLKKLSEINSIQIEIMDILCDMLQRAQSFKSAL